MRLVNAFKPDFRKVGIVILLLVSSSAVFHFGVICVEGGLVVGFPFAFFIQCNDMGPQGLIPGAAQVNPLSLILDIVLWYMVVALTIAAVPKLRARRDEQRD